MVLVVTLQHLLGQPLQRDAVAGQVVQDLLLVDRMAVVEVDDGVGGRLRAQAALLMSGRTSSRRLRRTVIPRTFALQGGVDGSFDPTEPTPRLP